MNWFTKLFSMNKPCLQDVDFDAYDPKEFLYKSNWNLRETELLDENHKLVFVISPMCRRCPYPHHLYLYLFYRIVNSKKEFDRLIGSGKTQVLKSFDFEKQYGIEQRVLAFNIDNGLALYEITNEHPRNLFKNHEY